MPQPYYICFSFKQVTYLGTDPQVQSDCFRFKAEVFQDHIFVGKTPYSEELTNSKSCFRNKNSLLSLQLPENFEFRPSYGEIRVIQKHYNSDEILIGCYSCPLHHHISAFKTLNKNCLRMEVQITKNYRLQYDVLIETTGEAFDQLKKQHFSAKRLEEASDISSVMGSFLPQEHLITTKRQSSKKLKMEGEAVQMTSRYWTPQKERKKQTDEQQRKRRSSFVLKKSQKSKHSENILKSSIKFTHKRSVSSCSEELKKKETLDTEPFEEELDTFSELSIEEKKVDKKQIVEELIRSESVIILPCQGNDYWTYKQLTDRGTEEETNAQTNEIMMGECEKMSRSSILKKIMLAMVILLIIGIGMGVMVKSVRKQKHRVFGSAKLRV